MNANGENDRVQDTQQTQGEGRRGFIHFFKIFIKDYAVLFIACVIINVVKELLYSGTESFASVPVTTMMSAIAYYAGYWATISYVPFVLSMRIIKSPYLFLALSMILFILKFLLEIDRGETTQIWTQFGPLYNEKNNLTLVGIASNLLTSFFFLVFYALYLVIKNNKQKTG
jgi:hypothetical protein